jgi:hypothetical protein
MPASSGIGAASAATADAPLRARVRVVRNFIASRGEAEIDVERGLG